MHAYKLDCRLHIIILLLEVEDIHCSLYYGRFRIMKLRLLSTYCDRIRIFYSNEMPTRGRWWWGGLVEGRVFFCVGPGCHPEESGEPIHDKNGTTHIKLEYNKKIYLLYSTSRKEDDPLETESITECDFFCNRLYLTVAAAIISAFGRLCLRCTQQQGVKSGKSRLF